MTARACATAAAQAIGAETLADDVGFQTKSAAETVKHHSRCYLKKNAIERCCRSRHFFVS